MICNRVKGLGMSLFALIAAHGARDAVGIPGDLTTEDQ